MTNGRNNPNDVPEEDWAMSEPDIPIKKESPVKPIDEKAASLYAPPDTGDLEGWDIGTQDEGLSDGEISPPPNYSEPTAFTPPQKAFEILKPVAPPKTKDDDWGISPTPQNDGWKMPEPIFRATEGEILTKVRRSSSKSNNAAPAQTSPGQEKLPDIYAPPDTQEESITEDFEISETPEESAEDLNFSSAPPAAAYSEQMPPQASHQVKGKKSKRGLFIMLGVVFAGILIIVLLAAGFGLFYYKDAIMK